MRMNILHKFLTFPVAGGSPYGVAFGGAGAGAGGVYAPPPYDQLQHHQAIPALSQQLPVSYFPDLHII